ncbi:MAG: hypothetical protein ACR2FO_05585, partial [Actinomycetota bacterium]
RGRAPRSESVPAPRAQGAGLRRVLRAFLRHERKARACAACCARKQDRNAAIVDAGALSADSG